MRLILGETPSFDGREFFDYGCVRAKVVVVMLYWMTSSALLNLYIYQPVVRFSNPGKICANSMRRNHQN